jgi:hypothetical protein
MSLISQPMQLALNATPLEGDPMLEKLQDASMQLFIIELDKRLRQLQKTPSPSQSVSGSSADSDDQDLSSVDSLSWPTTPVWALPPPSTAPSSPPWPSSRCMSEDVSAKSPAAFLLDDRMRKRSRSDEDDGRHLHLKKSKPASSSDRRENGNIIPRSKSLGQSSIELLSLDLPGRDVAGK